MIDQDLNLEDSSSPESEIDTNLYKLQEGLALLEKNKNELNPGELDKLTAEIAKLVNDINKKSEESEASTTETEKPVTKDVVEESNEATPKHTPETPKVTEDTKESEEKTPLDKFDPALSDELKPAERILSEEPLTQENTATKKESELVADTVTDFVKQRIQNYIPDFLRRWSDSVLVETMIKYSEEGKTMEEIVDYYRSVESINPPDGFYDWGSILSEDLPQGVMNQIEQAVKDKREGGWSPGEEFRDVDIVFDDGSKVKIDGKLLAEGKIEFSHLFASIPIAEANSTLQLIFEKFIQEQIQLRAS